MCILWNKSVFNADGVLETNENKLAGPILKAGQEREIGLWDQDKSTGLIQLCGDVRFLNHAHGQGINIIIHKSQWRYEAERVVRAGSRNSSLERRYKLWLSLKESGRLSRHEMSWAISWNCASNPTCMQRLIRCACFEWGRSEFSSQLFKSASILSIAQLF